ncbi:MAG TPA: hypothetical protein VGB95_02440, partial [Chitinophagales bacterium]
MRLAIITFCLLTILFSCNNKPKINWTSNSIFIGDTNIVIDLPNVIKVRTEEFKCSEDPFSTYTKFT